MRPCASTPCPVWTSSASGRSRTPWPPRISAWTCVRSGENNPCFVIFCCAQDDENKRMKIIHTDCLVLGAGLAGSAYALEAAKAGFKVELLSLGAPLQANSDWAQGGIIY